MPTLEDTTPTTTERPRVMFLYSSRPSFISSTIDIAISRLKLINRNVEWYSWREMPSQGMPIPEVVQSEIESSAAVVVDVTTLNLNVLFEIGMAAGLGIPILPIRDVTYVPVGEDSYINQGGVVAPVGADSYEGIGFLNVFGCFDFRNSDDIIARLHDIKLLPTDSRRGRDSIESSAVPRLLVINGAFESEGVRQLNLAFEAAEVDANTVAISSVGNRLIDLMKAVKSHSGVVVHLMDSDRRNVIDLLEPYRRGVSSENSRAIFLAGVAQGARVPLMLLQEGYSTHPIDYGSLVRQYADPASIPQLLEEFLNERLVMRGDNAQLERLLMSLLEESPSPSDDDDSVIALSSRMNVSPANFAKCWRSICIPLVNGENSFSFIQRRTRDSHGVFHFVRAAAQRAIANGRTSIAEVDIRAAAEEHSQSVLKSLLAELKPHEETLIPLLAAIGGGSELVLTAELFATLLADGISKPEVEESLGVLIDHGIFSIWDPVTQRVALYSLSVGFDDVILVVHPSLHLSLKLSSHSPCATYPPVWSIGSFG